MIYRPLYGGAMAQDLLAMGRGDAVHVDRATGLYAVDYGALDVDLHDLGRGEGEGVRISAHAAIAAGSP